MANAERLQTVMQYITDHPEEHNQGWWFSGSCGTAACFAGWAANLYAEQMGMERIAGSLYYRPIGTYWSVVHPDAKHVRSLAIEILDLDDNNHAFSDGSLVATTDASALFAAHNTQAEIQLMVKDLVNGESIAHNYTRGVYKEEAEANG